MTTTSTDAPSPPRSRRWDYEYDSDKTRPLIRHGYWPVLLSWAKRDFRARYSQSALRTLWSIWQPMSIVAINGVLFHVILGVDGGDLPYLSSIVASIMVYRYFSTGLGAASVIADNAGIVAKAYFPRDVIPLSTLAVSFVDLGVMFVILIIVAAAQGITITVTALAMPVIIVLLVALSVTVTLALSSVTVFVRDTMYLLPMMSQMIFLITPIMYPASQLPANLQWINSVNPLSVVVESTRDSMLRGVWPDWPLVGIHLATQLCLAGAAMWYFRALESRMADVA